VPASQPAAREASTPAAVEVPLAERSEQQAEPDLLAAPAPVPSSSPPPQVPTLVSPSEPEPLPERAPLPASVAEHLRAPEPDPKGLEKERIRLRQWPRG
jgi:hypothetical protein